MLSHIQGWSESIHTFSSFSKNLNIFQNSFYFFFQKYSPPTSIHFCHIRGSFCIPWSRPTAEVLIYCWNQSRLVGGGERMERSWLYRGWNNNCHLKDVQALEKLFFVIEKMWQGFSTSKSRSFVTDFCSSSLEFMIALTPTLFKCSKPCIYTLLIENTDYQ